MLRIIEQLTPRTITVYWSDAQEGHYSEQIWGLVKARSLGSCALSGARIQPGDAIFRPKAGRYPPKNRDAMIAVISLEDTNIGTGAVM